MARKKKSFLEQLTDLQIKQGFLPNTGVVSPIAIFGYIGEAGEVAGEISTPKGEFPIQAKLAQVMYSARSLDTIKKEIRDKITPPMEIVVDKPHLLLFELADHFYYMNAVCIELGVTHEQLAKMALDKELSYLNGKEPVKHLIPVGKPTSFVKPTPRIIPQLTGRTPWIEPEITGQTCSMEEGCLSCGS